MLSEAFTPLLLLPPLAFGPAPTPPAFSPPRELLCDIHDLGRMPEPPPFRWSAADPGLDPRSLRPPADRHVMQTVLEFVLAWGAVASTGGSWDERSWSTKNWQATGAVAPLLILPQTPSILNPRR